MRSVLKGIFLLFCCVVLLGKWVFAEAHFDVTVKRNVPTRMRDGAILRADIYRPKSQGKFPVLLARTPYNKESTPVFDPTFGKWAASRGYVVIIQDVRGRFASGGEWYPFKFASQDGYDTVEWAASLPYSNGKVGMVGASYLGFDQLLAAVAQPPHLKGIFPILAPSNLYADLIHEGGALNQWVVDDWTTGVTLGALLRHIHKTTDVKEWAWKLPLDSYPILDLLPNTALAPFYYDWIHHPSYDRYWKQWSVNEEAAKIRVPAYFVDGWYDLFLNGAIENYQRIKADGGTRVARQNVRLLIGPWNHGPFNGKIGDVDFGPQSRKYGLLAQNLILRWYDHLLKGVPNGIDHEKPVQYFVMGKDVWQEAETWPPTGTHRIRFYLQSQGAANSLKGDGMLATSQPRHQNPDHYVYDPAHPVPTNGGALCCDKKIFPAGAFDQRKIEARQDVLVYSTRPFQKEFEIAGPVRVDLYASSSAKDTDFTAKLVDVWPNGFAQNLADGILRARYRNSFAHPVLMKPGKIYKFAINLWATCDDFLPGHRMRLEISSSNFPHFDRNLNTGQDAAVSSRMIQATNTVYHNEHFPSALVVTAFAQ